MQNKLKSAIPSLILVIFGADPTSLNGQQISRNEFGPILKRGIAHEKAWEGRSFRFTRSETWRSRNPIDIIELDGDRNVRAQHFDPRAEAIESETIIIGDHVHERRSKGSWRVLTRDQLATERSTLRRKMVSAISAAENNVHRELAQSMLASTTAAVIGIHRSYYFQLQNVPENAVINSWGTRTDDGANHRVYSVNGSMRLSSGAEPDLRECAVNITYWFDEMSGILTKAQTRFEWVYTTRIKSYTTVFEWKLDPDIRILAPV